jgi:hypothetical protein
MKGEIARPVVETIAGRGHRSLVLRSTDPYWNEQSYDRSHNEALLYSL